MITFKNISIIIPVSSSENELEFLLKDLQPVADEAEIIIIKGSNRSLQLNEGAKKAKREFLWFLHADSRFQSNECDAEANLGHTTGRTQIIFEKNEYNGDSKSNTLSALLASINRYPDSLHYFNLKFREGSFPWIKINEFGCYLRSHILGLPFGDQGFCLSKRNFEMIGGFPEGARHGEDHLLVWHAKQRGIKIRCAGAGLKTSARRYIEMGWLKLTLFYARIWILQALNELLKLIKKGIKDRPDSSLIIFVKYPEPGCVKTRLGTKLGIEAAANFYKEMVEHTILVTKPSKNKYSQVIYFDPPCRNADFKSWLPNLELMPQSKGNLGERMKSAFEEGFKKSERALIIGSDCPEINNKLIEEAFDKLKSYDIVLGPARDGGYYLIGCKKLHPPLFDNIKWSTDSVLKETLATANRLRLSTHLLCELEDIDTIEEYGRFRKKVQSNSPSL